MTLYQRMIEAGLKVEGHYSDLRTPATVQAINAISEHELAIDRVVLWGQFRCQITGEMWLEVFGAYDPFWEKSNAESR